MPYRMPAITEPITEPLLRSRSGGLIAALAFATLATGLLQICLPLELHQLHATPNEIGLTLSMYGFGMLAESVVAFCRALVEVLNGGLHAETLVA